MKKLEIRELYTDYLIAQNKYSTATGLSELLSDEISHDQVTRFLNGDSLSSKDLWMQVKGNIRSIENTDDGVLILDDTINKKPYTKENAHVCWHYSHMEGRSLKGISLLTCLARYSDIAFPVGYEIIKKEDVYVDPKTGKERRKSAVSKNELFRSLIKTATKNGVKYKYILADNWFSSKENIECIALDLDKNFIMGIKSNRTVAMNLEDKINGNFKRIDSISLRNEVAQSVYLRGIEFPVQVVKKVFKNEDGSEGTLYLVTNDLELDGPQILEIYKKRWRIEEYHKSVKQNASSEKSPAKVIKSQANHIFCSILAFCKLERLKLKTALNHFAIKYKLLLSANQAALQELRKMNANCVT